MTLLLLDMIFEVNCSNIPRSTVIGCAVWLRLGGRSTESAEPVKLQRFVQTAFPFFDVVYSQTLHTSSWNRLRRKLPFPNEHHPAISLVGVLHRFLRLARQF